MKTGRSFLLGFAFLVFVFGAAVAQVPGVRSSDLAREEEMKRNEQRQTAKKRDPKEILAEVNEDMMRLNSINETIGSTLTSKTTLSFPSCVDQAAEIKERSTRLKNNLALPVDPKADKKDPLKGVDSTTLPPMLEVLNKLLTSFTHNPIFSDSGVVDLQLAGKAKQDLDDIIVVSEKVRKTAEKLSKSAARN